MHLSIVCPTTPCAGRGGGKRGDLLDLTLKTRPRGGAIDTEPSVWHAILALDVHYFRSRMIICCSIAQGEVMPGQNDTL